MAYNEKLLKVLKEKNEKFLSIAMEEEIFTTNVDTPRKIKTLRIYTSCIVKTIFSIFDSNIGILCQYFSQLKYPKEFPQDYYLENEEIYDVLSPMERGKARDIIICSNVSDARNLISLLNNKEAFCKAIQVAQNTETLSLVCRFFYIRTHHEGTNKETINILLGAFIWGHLIKYLKQGNRNTPTLGEEILTHKNKEQISLEGGNFDEVAKATSNSSLLFMSILYSITRDSTSDVQLFFFLIDIAIDIIIELLEKTKLRALEIECLLALFNNNFFKKILQTRVSKDSNLTDFLQEQKNYVIQDPQYTVSSFADLKYDTEHSDEHYKLANEFEGEEGFNRFVQLANVLAQEKYFDNDADTIQLFVYRMSGYCRPDDDKIIKIVLYDVSDNNVKKTTKVPGSRNSHSPQKKSFYYMVKEICYDNSKDKMKKGSKYTILRPAFTLPDEEFDVNEDRAIAKNADQKLKVLITKYKNSKDLK